MDTSGTAEGETIPDAAAAARAVRRHVLALEGRRKKSEKKGAGHCRRCRICRRFIVVVQEGTRCRAAFDVGTTMPHAKTCIGVQG